MDLKEKIEHILLQMPVVEPEVKFLDGYGYRFVILVVSGSFETMSDGDRQHMVWRNLLGGLTDREQESVEFVFTKAPSEIKSPRVESVIPAAPL